MDGRQSEDQMTTARKIQAKYSVTTHMETIVTVSQLSLTKAFLSFSSWQHLSAKHLIISVWCLRCSVCSVTFTQQISQLLHSYRKLILFVLAFLEFSHSLLHSIWYPYCSLHIPCFGKKHST